MSVLLFQFSTSFNTITKANAIKHSRVAQNLLQRKTRWWGFWADLGLTCKQHQQVLFTIWNPKILIECMHGGLKGSICDAWKPNVCKSHRGSQGTPVYRALLLGVGGIGPGLIHVSLPVPHGTMSHHFWFRSIFAWCKTAHSGWNGWLIFGCFRRWIRMDGLYHCQIACVWNGQFLAPCFRNEIRSWSFSREGSSGWFLFGLLCSTKNGQRTWRYFR